MFCSVINPHYLVLDRTEVSFNPERLCPFTNRNKRGDIGLARVGTAGDALGNRLLCAIRTCSFAEGLPPGLGPIISRLGGFIDKGGTYEKRSGFVDRS
jgi:hypothetical protein